MLDEAPELDKNMRPMMSAGSLLMKKVGSTAIRAAIEKHQPLLGVFGHIHESSGEQNIGRTKCLNPGSEYQNGVLRAYLIELDADQIVGKPTRIEG
jgi:Icc-related predicted phosphoesterase